MFCEKLQEFVMILIKKYHYNFPVEYFDDYCESFNKEEFLGMEQPEKKCNIRNDIKGEWHYPKGIYNEQIDRATKAKGELREHIDSFGKEVLDGDVFGTLQQDRFNFKEESEEKELEDDTQSINSLSSTLTSVETLGQVSIIEKSFAGIEVAAALNANVHKQPWYEYPRQVYNAPLLRFEDAVDISATKHGCGLKGKTIIATKDEGLPFLLVLDGKELLMEVTDIDSFYVGLQVSTTKYVCLEFADHVHRLEIKLHRAAIVEGGCIGFERYQVAPIEVLGQITPGIDIRHLRSRKKKRPRRRKQERRMKQIEKAGIG